MIFSFSAWRLAGVAPVLMVGVSLWALVGCAKRETAVEAGIRTQTLHIGNNAEPPDLDPQTNNSLVVSFIGQALFEGLVRLDNDGETLRPGVAESWEISEDGLRYTFHLREDAVWSNGDPLTSADFMAGFRRYMNPRLACEAVNYTYAIVGARDYAEGRNSDVESVGLAAPDARTFEIRLRVRVPYFLATLTNYNFAPAHRPSMDRFDAWEQRGGKWTQPGNLVSNGPFVLAEWRPGEVVAVTKNPRYWNAAQVKLQAIHFHPIEDAGTEERAYRAGQLHVTFSLSASKLKAYAERHAPELVSTPILRTNFITFGTTHAPFDDARVRRAFSLAIDRERIMAAVLPGQGDAAYTFCRPHSGGYDLPPVSRYDLAEAQRLLAEAGFPGGAGFPDLELTLPSRDADLLVYGQALQQMWKQALGVEVRLAPIEFKVWMDMVRNKTLVLSTDTWNMAVNDPVDLLALGVTGDPNNDAEWSNARYDAAFAGIDGAANEADRAAAILACERIIAEDVPYAPIYHAIRCALVHPSVRGWQGNFVQFIDWTAISLEK